MFWTLIILTIIVVGLWSILSSPSEKNGGTIDGFISEEDPNRVVTENKVVNDPYKKNYLSAGKQVLILYGTEYGFSETVAKKLYDRISTLENFQPRVINMINYESIEFDKETVLLVLCSTTGDGVPPADARPFLNWISSNPVDFKHLSYSVLALGDSAYPHFCRAGISLDDQIKILGAKQIVERSLVDLEDWTVINNWFSNVIQHLEQLPIDIKDDYLDVQSIGNESSGPSRSLPYLSTMIEKRDVTNQSSSGQDDKEVIHCEFDLRGSGLTYISGDALGIYPLNNTSDVDEIFRIVGSNRASPSDVVVLPSNCYGPLPEGNKVPLKEALTKYYDIKKVQPELIKALSESCSSMTEREKASSLFSQGSSLKDNSTLNKYIEERELTDVFADFSSCTTKLVDLLKHVRLLQPRYYSISSSPTVSLGAKVSVTAAVVRYESLGKPRTGVCTTFLCDRLKIGENCAIFISKNPEFRLPTDPNTPIIMIGPGTGIAPFRAFLQERCNETVLDQTTSSKSQASLNVLYFGCRHPDIDYLYRDEFEKLEKENKITLRTAFSRYQGKKVYVQHLIKEDSSNIWSLLQSGAHIYVCGDASKMARDVHEALLEIFQQEGKLSKEEADKFMESLEKGKRYQRDVWVT